VRLQFDGNQAFQLRAIESVADLLQGQPRKLVDFAVADLGPMFGSITNRLDLNEEQLLQNLRSVQERNGVALDVQLQTIDETIRTVAGDQQVRFANFSVEMETGTGKTYVYIRTALELNRRYGLRKFHCSRAISGGTRRRDQVVEDNAGSSAGSLRQRAIPVHGL